MFILANLYVDPISAFSLWLSQSDQVSCAYHRPFTATSPISFRTSFPPTPVDLAFLTNLFPLTSLFVRLNLASTLPNSSSRYVRFATSLPKSELAKEPPRRASVKYITGSSSRACRARMFDSAVNTTRDRESMHMQTHSIREHG